jgi:hypothetical protein
MDEETKAPSSPQPSSLRTVYDSRWDDAYQRLCAFRERHGHTDISYRHKDDLMLGRWGKELAD